MSKVIDLSLFQVGLAALLVLINGIISILFRLGIGRKLLIASLRTVIQLLIVGYLLTFVFQLESAPVVWGIFLIMVLTATQAAIKRNPYRYPGMYLNGFSVMFVTSGLLTLYATAVIISVEPPHTPQYFIPLAGMILGNTMNGISVGLERFIRALDLEHEQIESMLAWGASSWEACRRIVAEAVTTGMIPTINSMAVVGIVSLPGMMTGQILAGADPGVAVRYQIIIMFLIAAGTGLGTTGVVLLSFRQLFNKQHRLLREQLKAR